MRYRQTKEHLISSMLILYHPQYHLYSTQRNHTTNWCDFIHTKFPQLNIDLCFYSLHHHERAHLSSERGDFSINCIFSEWLQLPSSLVEVVSAVAQAILSSSQIPSIPLCLLSHWKWVEKNLSSCKVPFVDFIKFL